jgi:hypothetical protein
MALEVQRGVAGGASKVLSKAMFQQMLTPGLNDWGLGPQLGGSEGHRYFEHGGANEGYRRQLVAYNQGDGVVIMTNSDSGNPLAMEIVRSVAHEYGGRISNRNLAVRARWIRRWSLYSDAGGR